MNIRILLLSLSLSFTAVVGEAHATEFGARESSQISFDGQEYLYKWSSDDLHEFTPGEQNVTGQWTDMLTVNDYPLVSSGEDLAVVANAVISNYEDVGGIVLGVESIPRTKLKPAEYIIAVVFGAPEAAEFAMVKFQLHEGIGSSIAYAHREYGADVGNVMNDWMEAHGTRLQEVVTKFTDMPSYSEFQKNESSELLSSLEQSI